MHPSLLASVLGCAGTRDGECTRLQKQSWPAHADQISRTSRCVTSAHENPTLDQFVSRLYILKFVQSSPATVLSLVDRLREHGIEKNIQ
jgi:hypothetical protein